MIFCLASLRYAPVAVAWRSFETCNCSCAFDFRTGVSSQSRSRKHGRELAHWQTKLVHKLEQKLLRSMSGANRNSLEWLELEDDDDDEIDAQTSEWEAASIQEVAILGPTKRTRKIRPDTLEPLPPTPKAEPPCFAMNWILQWLTTTPRPQILVLETISPVSVSTTPTCKRVDATVPTIEESCCSTAASSISDDPDSTSKLINSVPEKPPSFSRTAQDRGCHQSRGWIADDHEYQEYLTTKYHS